ncbi:Pectate lyase superfamily protein [Anaerohalosphaera lusitana]|uniref:Pectate lyase superfamily protein n=1 Tax=Anaerohalosphaera lusitana TaxID=1936003 RepID=A0A1U9NQB8_9BACT|nr:glycosyl hydrolase family 28-related protein [Anaerohalosphaera lusitana]AQT69810.1 Pectate lyase superfamily protein [Anaerohalosphaera lusitana]
MHRCLIFTLMLMLSIGTLSTASTVWDPASNGITPPDTGDWGVAANWTNGLPSDVTDGKAQFNRTDAAECLVTDSQTCILFVQGDNGPGGVIRVTDGGSITTGANWSAVGYNNTAHTIVETGGTINFGSHLWVGLNAPSVGTLDINGGTVNVAGQIGLGWSSGTGYVNVNAGTLNLDRWDATSSINGDSVLDISNGTVTINGDVVDEANAYASAGKITAFGGDGQIAAEYGTIPGKTTITAVPSDSGAPTPNPATFDLKPVSTGPDTITMTATIGSDDDGPVEYYFDETTGNPGGADSGWITSNTYTNTGLSADTTYTYTVTMRDSYGTEGTASDPQSVSTWSSTTTSIVWDTYAASADWGTASNWSPYISGSPEGNFKCVFNRSGTAEAVVTDVHYFNQLVQGDNGAADAGVIRVKDGGSLNTASGWSGIGYNRKAKMIVEAGGQVNFGGHLWVGQNSGGVGTLDLQGGTVNVKGSFSLGWSGGTGYANIKDGVLNLNQWAGLDAVKGSSHMDIEHGQVVIGGRSQTGVVDEHVKAGRITAFGGTGRIIYDYNITNPGKTTIRAIEGVDGDVNRDGGVNMLDLADLADDWLTADCDSPANFDEWCLVDFHDFASIAANWQTGVATNWHVADTIYMTEDIIVTPYRAENFGIVADGVTDVTDEIQDALIFIDNIGGGTLFLPAGNYKVSGNLTIPGRVMLRGDWQQPQPGSPVVGTVLQAYAGRGDQNAAPFIELSGSSGINGITIWYPEQTPDNIQPYPPTIHGGGNTVENVTFVNSYFAFTTFREGTTARPFVRNVYGTPLKTGIEFDCLADIGRMETVHFSPDYWAGSGLPNAPTAGQHESWIYNNGTGVIVRRIDWSYSCYVTVEGYSIGFALRPSRNDGKVPNGQSYAFDLIDCKTGVHIEASAYAGYQFTRFNIQDAQTGVYLASTSSETDMFHTCTISASGDAILSDGSAKVMIMSCDIQQGPLDINGGYLSVINSSFADTASNDIELAGNVRGASILGNTFIGGAHIADNTAYPVHIDHTPLAVDPLPAYDYRKPATVYQPAKADLFVVTDPPYNAVADGVTDNTAAFQSALTAADANGGGIVFVPGGTYRLEGTLVVPSGVELRGVYDCPHGTSQKGSLLNVYAGRNNANGTPFIQLESGAGIRGLNFHYPEQIYDENDTTNYGMAPYPFLIRGLGSDVYVINIAATIPYQLLDLATYRCDRHYIDYIMSTALKIGIHVGNGSTDGQIHNCQLNPSAFTHQGSYYESIPYGTADDIHKIQWRDATPYLFGHMTGQVLHENFVFGGAKGVHLVNENGNGPSGYCMGMGVDQCTNAMQIDDIGSGGLDMINSQIVTVNSTSGRYLETGASLIDTFRMFSCSGWGSHQYSAVINGGDVRLQLFHLARDGEAGAFAVHNTAQLESLGGDLRDYLGSGRPFLTIDGSASAAFIGNVINTDPSQMPANTSNVTSIGNLRVQ